jgi:hypothetical protein
MLGISPEEPYRKINERRRREKCIIEQVAVSWRRECAAEHSKGLFEDEDGWKYLNRKIGVPEHVAGAYPIRRRAQRSA